MSARPPIPLLPLAFALAGVLAVAVWRWARLSSLDEAAALALALAVWFAARRAGLAGALALALGVIAGEWLRPWSPVRLPALPGLEGVSCAMVLLMLAWVLGRAARPAAGGSPPAEHASPTVGDEVPAIEDVPAEPPAPASAPARSAGDPELVGQVAHELRTPLNAMAGWLHVLEAGAEFGEETRAKARAGLRRAVLQQRDLIDAVDELSRASTGDLSLARAPADLRAMLAGSVVQGLASLGEGRVPTLQAPPDGPAIWVEVDAERMSRVVVDLLVAIARLADGAAVVRLSAGTQGGVAWVSWTVPRGDDPQGQAFDTALRERVDGHLRRGRPRPPLLAVRRARAIAELHGGTLVRVDDGEASGLRLELPLGDGPAAPRGQAPADAAPRGLRGLRLLVVDDQEEMRDMLVALLGQQGARVSQAEGAGDAFDLIGAAGEDRFDLAVLDVAMPGEDGLSLVRRIRERERRDGRVPMGAIALTAHAGGALEREALACGFDAFLPKPLDPARLVATIRSIRPAT